MNLRRKSSDYLGEEVNKGYWFSPELIIDLRLGGSDFVD